MIASFGNAATADFYHGRPTAAARRIPSTIARSALHKLDMLNAAKNLQDLRSPPGNRLERLVGELAGFHSIRVNDQWRVVFRWEGSDAHDVRIADYH